MKTATYLTGGLALVLLAASTILVGCFDEAPDMPGIDCDAGAMPTARIETSVLTIVPGIPVEFDGDGSSTGVTGQAQYQWSLVSGPSTEVGIRNRNLSSAWFTFPEDGEYEVQLTVTNFCGESDSEIITVATASNACDPTTGDCVHEDDCPAGEACSEIANMCVEVDDDANTNGLPDDVGSNGFPGDVDTNAFPDANTNAF